MAMKLDAGFSRNVYYSPHPRTVISKGFFIIVDIPQLIHGAINQLKEAINNGKRNSFLFKMIIYLLTLSLSLSLRFHYACHIFSVLSHFSVNSN